MGGSVHSLNKFIFISIVIITVNSCFLVYLYTNYKKKALRVKNWSTSTHQCHTIFPIFIHLSRYNKFNSTNNCYFKFF